MEYRNYLTYKVYEDGTIVNKKGVILKPQYVNNWAFYKLNKKRLSAVFIILFAFGIYPKYFKQNVKHIDKNKTNNALINLTYE